MSIVMENANCFDFLPKLEDNSVDLVLTGVHGTRTDLTLMTRTLENGIMS